MNPTGKLPSSSAALAGIPAGVQTCGPWSGRRQLFIRFAVEAETATIYSAAALRGELARLTARSRYHSIAITGRDALAEEQFLRDVFETKSPLPVMLDHDGQRPAELQGLLDTLSLVQVTLEGTEGAPALERASQTIALAARKQVTHTAVVLPLPSVSDGSLLRIVEQIHGASADTVIVVHPVSDRSPDHDRRWASWLEQAMAVHADVRVLSRWPVPATRAEDAGTRNARSG